LQSDDAVDKAAAICQSYLATGSRTQSTAVDGHVDDRAVSLTQLMQLLLQSVMSFCYSSNNNSHSHDSVHHHIIIIIIIKTFLVFF